MRQREDKEFAEILNRIREGNHTEADIEVSKERILNINPQHPDYPISLTHLFSTNMAVDQHNHDVFQKVRQDQVLSGFYFRDNILRMIIAEKTIIFTIKV